MRLQYVLGMVAALLFATANLAQAKEKKTFCNQCPAAIKILKKQKLGGEVIDNNVRYIKPAKKAQKACAKIQAKWTGSKTKLSGKALCGVCDRTLAMAKKKPNAKVIKKLEKYKKKIDRATDRCFNILLNGDDQKAKRKAFRKWRRDKRKKERDFRKQGREKRREMRKNEKP